jgi:hypothetical protein
VVEMRLPLTLAVAPVLTSWRHGSLAQPWLLALRSSSDAGEPWQGGRTAAASFSSSSVSSSSSPPRPGAATAVASADSTAAASAAVASEEAAFWQTFTHAIPPERVGVWRALDRGLQAYRGQLERRAELNRQVGALRRTTLALRQSLAGMLSDPANARMLQPPVLAAAVSASTAASVSDLALAAAAAAAASSTPSTLLRSTGGTDPREGGACSPTGGGHGCDDDKDELGVPPPDARGKWGAVARAPMRRAQRGGGSGGGGGPARGKPGSALGREESGSGGSSDGRLKILGRSIG